MGALIPHPPITGKSPCQLGLNKFQAPEIGPLGFSWMPLCKCSSLMASMFSLSTSLIWLSIRELKWQVNNTILFWWNLSILWVWLTQHFFHFHLSISNQSRNSCGRPWNTLVHKTPPEASLETAEIFSLIQNILRDRPLFLSGGYFFRKKNCLQAVVGRKKLSSSR